MVNSRPMLPFTPVLACADTNAAVDNIVEGLVSRRINVVRLGQPAKVNPLLLLLLLLLRRPCSPNVCWLCFAALNQAVLQSCCVVFRPAMQAFLQYRNGCIAGVIALSCSEMLRGM